MFLRNLALLISVQVGLIGCATYKQNIMFKTPEGFIGESLKQEADKATKNYVIQKNDYLSIQIFTNNGEKMIDPNPEVSQLGESKVGDNQAKQQFLVDINGISKFPLIGELKIEGLTLREAEQMIQKEYEKFYKDPFVTLTFNNKRVVVLGAPGGLVIPLVNENVTLAEVLALSKGVENDGKAHNIRVLRGEKVYVIDFSTIEGYRSGNMKIEPGDIVYVEPVRKPLAEGFRDYYLIMSLLVGLSTFITILSRL